MNGRSRATHWADVLAARYAPTKEQVIAEAVRRIEDEHEDAQEIEFANMIRQAHARVAGTEWVPLPPKHERIAAERIRLEAMTTDEILAERAEEERQLRELVEQAKAESAAEEERIKAYYGGTPATPGTKIHGDLSDSPEGFLVAE